MDIPRLLALSPGDLGEVQGLRTEGFVRAVGRALDAGLPGLLLREPRLGDGAALRLLDAVLSVAEERGALWLAVHDRVHLALVRECAAIHLGGRSLAAAAIRESLAGRRSIGLSTHAGDTQEDFGAADYLFHSPVRPTKSKPGARPIGPEGVAEFVGRSGGRPVLALGGIRPDDVGACLAAGAHGVAVLSGIFAAEDPAAATRAYLRALGEHAPAPQPREDGEDV